MKTAILMFCCLVLVAAKPKPKPPLTPAELDAFLKEGETLMASQYREDQVKGANRLAFVYRVSAGRKDAARHRKRVKATIPVLLSAWKADEKRRWYARENAYTCGLSPTKVRDDGSDYCGSEIGDSLLEVLGPEDVKHWEDVVKVLNDPRPASLAGDEILAARVQAMHMLEKMKARVALPDLLNFAKTERTTNQRDVNDARLRALTVIGILGDEGNIPELQSMAQQGWGVYGFDVAVRNTIERIRKKKRKH